MVKIIQGAVDRPLEVTEEVTIQGALSAAAVVRHGGSLVLQGASAAPIRVERGGRLLAAGALVGNITIDAGATATLTGTLLGQVVNHGAVLNDLVDEHGAPVRIAGPGTVKLVEDLSAERRADFEQYRPQQRVKRS
jgi:hypothetical protein